MDGRGGTDAAILAAETPWEDGAEGEDIDEQEAAANLQAFERQYLDTHSWEALQEDEHGRLRPVDPTHVQRARRQRLLDLSAAARIRRGMIRYLELIVDASGASGQNDMKPNRLATLLSIVKGFVREFFDQNPLSHLGLILMRQGLAERIKPLSASPDQHVAALEAGIEPAGAASLQNALDQAVQGLAHVPPYGYREALVLFASLTTCDPGNILDTIRALKDARVRVSVIGMAAEVYLCKKIAQDTGGTYGVALDARHLQELVVAHASPPATEADRAGSASLVAMGFPSQEAQGSFTLAFAGEGCELVSGSYTCPRCKARALELPCQCHVCGLTLISSPHLARSYHHLFPVAPFEEVSRAALPASTGCRLRAASDEGVRPWKDVAHEVYCYGCLRSLAREDEGVVVSCPNCGHLFCFFCDAYIHEALHNCPGCQAEAPKLKQDSRDQAAATPATA